jgi:hypothetical protein
MGGLAGVSGSRKHGRLFSSPYGHTSADATSSDLPVTLSPRARNILLDQGIRTAEDLRYVAQLAEKDLLRWPRAGKVIAAEIMRAARALAGSPDAQS